MGFFNIVKGLTLKVPTVGTTEYAQTLVTDLWQKISEHDHSGSPKGLAVKALGKNYVLDTTATAITPSGGNVTVDWDAGNFRRINLSGASGTSTGVFSNPEDFSKYTLLITTSPSNHGITWPGAFVWKDNTAPNLNSSAQPVLIELVYYGGVYYGIWHRFT